MQKKRNEKRDINRRKKSIETIYHTTLEINTDIVEMISKLVLVLGSFFLGNHVYFTIFCSVFWQRADITQKSLIEKKNATFQNMHTQ